MSKKDRIFRVLSIVLLMTMLLFSFGCAGQESLSEINSSAISSDVSDVSENPSVSSTETEGTSTETPSSNSLPSTTDPTSTTPTTPSVNPDAETPVSMEQTLKLYGNMSSKSDSAAASLRNTIIGKENLTKTGRKTFYISAHNGNDSNDGLSPSQAWKTLDALSAYNYLIGSGDVVLLERGGVYRGTLNAVSGVTYGAYGSGRSPAYMAHVRMPQKAVGKNPVRQTFILMASTLTTLESLFSITGKRWGLKSCKVLVN